jgi:hypothetical protein
MLHSWLFPDVSNELVAFMKAMDLEPLQVKAARSFETSRIAQQRSVTFQKSGIL